MSKILEFKDKDKTNDKKLSKSTIVWASLIVVACIIAVIGGIFGTKDKSQSENNTSASGGVGYVEGQDYSDSNITTYTYEHEVLHGDDITQAVSNINSVMDYVRDNNAYTRVQVGEYDYDYYIYNRDGECFAQTADGVTCIVFRKDGYESIAFGGDTGNVLEGYNLDILSIVDNVVSLAASDTDDKEGITVFDMVFAEGEDVPNTTHEYRVEIAGEDNFKQIYSGANEELGEDIIATLKEQVAEVSENEYIPHIIYMFLLDTEDKLLTISCSLVVDGEEHTNWVLDGYNTLGDWQLSEDWYTEDFSIMTTDEAFDKLEVIINDLQSLINEYFGAEDTEEESVSSSEDLEDTSENSDESEENSSLDTDNESSNESPDASLDVEDNSTASEE